MKNIINNDMPPNEIRIAFLRAGITQSEIARELDVSGTLIWRIIEGVSRSDRVQQAISRRLGIDKDKIWPSIYLNGGPIKKGRPLGGRFKV